MAAWAVITKLFFMAVLAALLSGCGEDSMKDLPAEFSICNYEKNECVKLKVLDVPYLESVKYIKNSLLVRYKFEDWRGKGLEKGKLYGTLDYWEDRGDNVSHNWMKVINYSKEEKMIKRLSNGDPVIDVYRGYGEEKVGVFIYKDKNYAAVVNCRPSLKKNRSICKFYANISKNIAFSGFYSWDKDVGLSFIFFKEAIHKIIGSVEEVK